jgi:hypothetical protein
MASKFMLWAGLFATFVAGIAAATVFIPCGLIQVDLDSAGDQYIMSNCRSTLTRTFHLRQTSQLTIINVTGDMSWEFRLEPWPTNPIKSFGLTVDGSSAAGVMFSLGLASNRWYQLNATFSSSRFGRVIFKDQWLNGTSLRFDQATEIDTAAFPIAPALPSESLLNGVTFAYCRISASTLTLNSASVQHTTVATPLLADAAGAIGFHNSTVNTSLAIILANATVVVAAGPTTLPQDSVHSIQFVRCNSTTAANVSIFVTSTSIVRALSPTSATAVFAVSNSSLSGLVVSADGVQLEAMSVTAAAILALRTTSLLSSVSLFTTATEMNVDFPPAYIPSQAVQNFTVVAIAAEASVDRLYIDMNRSSTTVDATSQIASSQMIRATVLNIDGVPSSVPLSRVLISIRDVSTIALDAPWEASLVAVRGRSVIDFALNVTDAILNFSSSSAVLLPNSTALVNIESGANIASAVILLLNSVVDMHASNSSRGVWIHDMGSTFIGSITIDASTVTMYSVEGYLVHDVGPASTVAVTVVVRTLATVRIDAVATASLVYVADTTAQLPYLRVYLYRFAHVTLSASHAIFVLERIILPSSAPATLVHIANARVTLNGVESALMVGAPFSSAGVQPSREILVNIAGSASVVIINRTDGNEMGMYGLLHLASRCRACAVVITSSATVELIDSSTSSAAVTVASSYRAALVVLVSDGARLNYRANSSVAVGVYFRGIADPMSPGATICILASVRICSSLQTAPLMTIRDRAVVTATNTGGDVVLMWANGSAAVGTRCLNIPDCVNPLPIAMVHNASVMLQAETTAVLVRLYALTFSSSYTNFLAGLTFANVTCIGSGVVVVDIDQLTYPYGDILVSVANNSVINVTAALTTVVLVNRPVLQVSSGLSRNVVLTIGTGSQLVVAGTSSVMLDIAATVATLQNNTDTYNGIVTVNGGASVQAATGLSWGARCTYATYICRLTVDGVGTSVALRGSSQGVFHTASNGLLKSLAEVTVSAGARLTIGSPEAFMCQAVQFAPDQLSNPVFAERHVTRFSALGPATVVDVRCTNRPRIVAGAVTGFTDVANGAMVYVSGDSPVLAAGVRLTVNIDGSGSTVVLLGALQARVTATLDRYSAVGVAAYPTLSVAALAVFQLSNGATATITSNAACWLSVSTNTPLDAFVFNVTGPGTTLIVNSTVGTAAAVFIYRISFLPDLSVSVHVGATVRVVGALETAVLLVPQLVTAQFSNVEVSLSNMTTVNVVSIADSASLISFSSLGPLQPPAGFVSPTMSVNGDNAANILVSAFLVAAVINARNARFTSKGAFSSITVSLQSLPTAGAPLLRSQISVTGNESCLLAAPALLFDGAPNNVTLYEVHLANLFGDIQMTSRNGTAALALLDSSDTETSTTVMQPISTRLRLEGSEGGTTTLRLTGAIVSLLQVRRRRKLVMAAVWTINSVRIIATCTSKAPSNLIESAGAGGGSFMLAVSKARIELHTTSSESSAVIEVKRGDAFSACEIAIDVTESTLQLTNALARGGRSSGLSIWTSSMEDQDYFSTAVNLSVSRSTIVVADAAAAYGVVLSVASAKVISVILFNANVTVAEAGEAQPEVVIRTFTAVLVEPPMTSGSHSVRWYELVVSVIGCNITSVVQSVDLGLVPNRRRASSIILRDNANNIISRVAHPLTQGSAGAAEIGQVSATLDNVRCAGSVMIAAALNPPSAGTSPAETTRQIVVTSVTVLPPLTPNGLTSAAAAHLLMGNLTDMSVVIDGVQIQNGTLQLASCSSAAINSTYESLRSLTLQNISVTYKVPSHSSNVSALTDAIAFDVDLVTTGIFLGEIHLHQVAPLQQSAPFHFLRDITVDLACGTPFGCVGVTLGPLVSYQDASVNPYALRFINGDVKVKSVSWPWYPDTLLAPLPQGAAGMLHHVLEALDNITNTAPAFLLWRVSAFVALSVSPKFNVTVANGSFVVVHDALTYGEPATFIPLSDRMFLNADDRLPTITTVAIQQQSHELLEQPIVVTVTNVTCSIVLQGFVATSDPVWQATSPSWISPVRFAVAGVWLRTASLYTLQFRRCRIGVTVDLVFNTASDALVNTSGIATVSVGGFPKKFSILNSYVDTNVQLADAVSEGASSTVTSTGIQATVEDMITPSDDVAVIDVANLTVEVWVLGGSGTTARANGIVFVPKVKSIRELNIRAHVVAPFVRSVLGLTCTLTAVEPVNITVSRVTVSLSVNQSASNSTAQQINGIVWGDESPLHGSVVMDLINVTMHLTGVLPSYLTMVGMEVAPSVLADLHSSLTISNCDVTLVAKGTGGFTDSSNGVFRGISVYHHPASTSNLTLVDNRVAMSLHCGGDARTLLQVPRHSPTLPDTAGHSPTLPDIIRHYS